MDLRILNGRTNGDTLGRPTYHGRNGTSVVDYIICDHEIFSEQPSYLSDHSQVVGWFKSKVSTSPSHSDKQANLETLTKLPPQFIWENDSSLKFSSSLNLPNIQTMIDNFLNKDFTKVFEVSIQSEVPSK